MSRFKTKRRAKRGDNQSASPEQPSQPGQPIIGASRKWRLVLLVCVLSLLLGAWAASGKFLRRINVNEVFPQAIAAAERGDNEAAAKLLDDVLWAEPEHHEARLYRGQVARDLGDLTGAIEHWRSIPDQPAKFGGVARYLDATVCLQQGKAREAEYLLLRSIELNKAYLQPRERLIELYVAQSRSSDIRQQLDALRFLRPWKLEELVLYTIAGQRLMDPQEGIKRLERFVRADPEDMMSALALAKHYADAEQFEAATRLTDQLLRNAPGNSQVLGLIAQVQLRKDDLAAAAKTLDQVPRDRAVAPLFWKSCGDYWWLRGDAERATMSLLQASLHDPEDLATHQSLGSHLRRLGRDEEALVHLRKAELIERVLRQASRVARRDRQNDQLVVPILIDVAESLVGLKRFDEAVHWYDQALILDPKSTEATRGIRKIAATVDSNPSIATRPPLPSPQSVLEALQKVVPQQEQQVAMADHANTAKSTRRIALRDVHQEAGIDFEYFNGQTGFKYLLESMGGAVAVLDYDGDHWSDLYFSQGCTLPYDPNRREYTDRLYRNLGNGRFEDVTEAAGLGDNQYGQGCTAGDFDNDGDPDLMLANYGENAFYRNNGDGTFTEVTEEVGLKMNIWSSSVAFADFDRDGYLDLYVVTYVDSLKVCRAKNGHVATCDPQNFGAEEDALFRNRGDGTFENVSKTCGILAPDGKGLGLVVADLNDDLWPDIYVANDGTPNFLFRNQGVHDGFARFDSYGLLSGTAVNAEGKAEGGMGIACADFQNDGTLDLYVTNFYMETNTLYANRGDLFFEDTTRQAKVSPVTRPMVGFGVQAIDLDLDGIQELLMANGHIDDFRFRDEPWKMPSQLFRGLGQGDFEDISLESGEYFHQEFLGRGLARLDWDRDGDSDAVVVHQGAPAALLTNETKNAGGRLVFTLNGVESNRDAIGARIEVTAGGRRQVHEMIGGDGFYSRNERSLIIGIADSETAVVEVRWPTGERQKLENVPANSRITVVEGQFLSIEPISPLTSPQ